MSFVPVTPGGTICIWLEADTEEEAWENLIEDASHMPYKIKEAFEERGYEVCEMKEIKHDNQN